MLEKYLNNIEIPVEVYQFDAEAPDDLYELFSKTFLSVNNSDLKKLTLLKENKIIDLNF